MEDDGLLDYEDTTQAEQEVDELSKEKKGTGYVGIHTSGFRDFLLKPELLRAIGDCGFEGPSQVQHECIPQAILGTDVVCQAQSGMGKTAVFVLSTLHILQPVDGEVSVLVMCHTRDLANQIKDEYERFSKYFADPEVRIAVFYGGEPIANNEKMLKDTTKCPHIVVGTPGRILDLVSPDNPSRCRLSLSKLKVFVLDECDKMLETSTSMSMRRDVQSIFRATPRNKQVLMFSATLSKEIRPVCKKFMHEPMEIYVDDQSKLSLEGLKQHYVKLTQEAKLKKLVDLMDVLEFNQVMIFTSSIQRCQVLCKHLVDSNFPAMYMHGRMPQAERVEAMKLFKNFEKRIMVTTNLLGRGIDIERVNIVINFDMPEDTDTYLHRVARAGRFGTKGLAISFISTSEDSDILEKVQARFEVDIQELPEELNLDSYM